MRRMRQQIDDQRSFYLRRAHLPLIPHETNPIAPSTWVVVLQSVDAHADIRIHVAHQVVTMLGEAFDDRCAVDLMDFVMHHSRSRRPIRSEAIGIPFGEIRHD